MHPLAMLLGIVMGSAVSITVALVLTLVVFLFLQSWRATVIPMIAVPVSLVATFAAFVLLGFTINTLTLFGMVLAIGIVVDDAIVVLENIHRRIELGEPPLLAALRGGALA